MHVNHLDTLDNDCGFAEAVTAYVKAVDAGQSPDPQEWLERYPELAAELADFFAGQWQLDRLSVPLRALVPAAELPSCNRLCRAIPDDGPIAHADSAISWPPIKERVFGDYELLEVIAQGGMGIVYKARHARLNRIVALKLILSGQLAKRSDVQRFHAEAEAAASLDHPHIVPIYEVGEAQGQHYFTMKLVEGPSFAQRLGGGQPHGGTAIRGLVTIVAAVARAVHYAHQRGILHRDLKPGNILLDSAEQPYVTDFGLAKLVAGDRTGTQSGTIVGTASYMAPEQAAGSKGLTTAADIYSLGAILYEMLTGRPPFREETALETLLHVREREPARPSDVHPQVDRDLETICLKCLEKDPLRRYGSAEALADELERWLAGEPIQARPTGRVERAWRRCRRNPLVASLVAAVVLVAVGGILGVLGQWQVALANEQKANEHAAQAQGKAREATQQRDEAQRQRDEVRAVASKLRSAQEQLQRTLYDAHMNLAQQAWDASGVGRVLDLLDQHRPKPGEADLRGFEWHYLNRLCHSELLTLKLPEPNFAVAVSADGKRLASSVAGRGGTVKVWDAQTGQELLILKGHSGAVWSVAFSPDGKRLACGEQTIDEQGNRVKVWDAQTGRELLALKGHTNRVRSVAFSPDSTRLASASDDQTLKVWDVQSGQELLTLKGHTSFVFAVGFSPDGNRLASGSEDDTVKMWDARTGLEILALKGHHGSVFCVAFSPDGKRLASGSTDQTVKIWDVQTGHETLTVIGHTNAVGTVAFAPDGKRLASAGVYDRTVKVWNVQTGQELRRLKGHTGLINSVMFSPDGTCLTSTDNDGVVKLWDGQTAQPRALKGHTKSVNQVAFSLDGKRLASASDDQTVKLWDVQTGQETLTFKGHTGLVQCVVFSPDGQRLASGTGRNGRLREPFPNDVKVWDARTGQEIHTLNGHTNNVSALAFSPDGNRLASASDDGAVKLWDTQTGQDLLTLKGHTNRVHGLAFSPDGKYLASASRDRASQDERVKLWDAQTGEETPTLKGTFRLFGSGVFSPDGQRLASGSQDQAVKVWDVQTGQDLLSLKGHTDSVGRVAFSPDGQRLASASRDQTMKLWDTSTGQELLTLKDTGQPVFSPDGKLLATVSRHGYVQIWDATPLPANKP